jgi:hypothetical protein
MIKLAVLFIASITLSAHALPAPDTDTYTDVYQCTTGDAYCCNTFEYSEAYNYPELLGLGAIISGLQIPVHTDCSAVTVFGIKTGEKWYAPRDCYFSRFADWPLATSNPSAAKTILSVS